MYTNFKVGFHTRYSGVLLALVFLLSGVVTRARADDGSQVFPETGHTVSGKFLTYWQTNGGLAVFGYPLTDAQDEVDPETGKTFLTQWFERTRFELHPENAGTRYEILTGLIGKDLRREALQVDPDFQHSVAFPNNPGGQYFPETGHNVDARFLNYWQHNGGLERFGFPISEAHSEIDPQTGKPFYTQWFERARFEYHLENAGTQYEVLLGLLGNEIKTPQPGFRFAWKLGADYQFKSPKGLAVDQAGNLYVADGDAFTLAVFQNDGKLIKKFGGIGGEDQLFGNFGTPTAVDVIGSGPNLTIYTNRCGGSLHDLTCSIQTLDGNGNPLKRWDACSKKNDFSSCILVDSLAVDIEGNSYVATFASSKILSFDNQGNFRASWSISANLSIGDLTIDKATGNLYVADISSSQVWIFDKNGHLLRKVGGPGTQDGQFQQINGMAVDQKGNLYVADGTIPRIQKFDAAGKFVAKWGSFGDADGQFHYLEALSVDAAGNVFVSNFDPTPPLLEQVVKFRQIPQN